MGKNGIQLGQERVGEACPYTIPGPNGYMLLYLSTICKLLD